MLVIPQELKSEYPFQSHFIQLDNEKMHYIDEGSTEVDSEVILMLHGNPTWSFLYRNLAKYFSKGQYRVIVPDHLGCGLSSKPQDYNYSLSNHVENIIKLVEHLKLKNINLIVHDWGGAIGMGLATSRPDLIKRIVVMNTAAFISAQIPLRINILRNPIGEWFIRSFNGFAGPATIMAVTKRMEPNIKKGFILPYDNYESRIATAKFVRDIPMNIEHPTYKTLNSIEGKLSSLNKPVLILWGAKDFCFTLNFQKKWLDFFPKAKVKIYADAGHYLTEDKPIEVQTEIETFLKQ